MAHIKTCVRFSGYYCNHGCVISILNNGENSIRNAEGQNIAVPYYNSVLYGRNNVYRSL